MFDVTVHDLGIVSMNVRRNATDPLIFVVGNKLDLLEDRAIVKRRVEDFAGRHNAQWILTSAKTASAIEAFFDHMLEGLIHNSKTASDGIVSDSATESGKSEYY
jgi:50S ribosomal subunit-associated GTPase HflX